MAEATVFERTVYVAEYQGKRALAAGRRNDAKSFERHSRIMNELIEGSEYPDIARQELTHLLGRSKAAVLKITRPVLNLA